MNFPYNFDERRYYFVYIVSICFFCCLFLKSFVFWFRILRFLRFQLIFGFLFIRLPFQTRIRRILVFSSKLEWTYIGLAKTPFELTSKAVANDIFEYFFETPNRFSFRNETFLDSSFKLDCLLIFFFQLFAKQLFFIIRVKNKFSFQRMIHYKTNQDKKQRRKTISMENRILFLCRTERNNGLR